MRVAFKTSALFAALAFLIVLAAPAAQHHAGDTAKDPVCGMDVKKSEAKAAFDYKGTTYYFCAVSCKDKFAQDPEKYLQKEAGKTEKVEKIVKVVKEGKAECSCPHCRGKASEMTGHCPHCGKDMAKSEAGKAQGCPMMRSKMAMMHGQKAGGMGMNCPMAGLMHGPDVELKVENTKDGIQVSLSSKNAEVVKKLQDMAAKMKACRESKDCGGDCSDK